MSGGFNVDANICGGSDLGTNAATSLATNIANSATAGTYGSYVQLAASTAADAVFAMININGGFFTNSNNMIVKIAVGGAGSEVDIIKDLMFFDGAGYQTSVVYGFPVNILAGTRISAAAAGNLTGADSIDVQVTIFDGTFAQPEGAGVDTIGQASAAGTTLVAGAANVKGSYAQLIASTARDYKGFVFALDAKGLANMPNTPYLIDIAIGAAASEVVIVPNYPGNPTAGSSNLVPQNGVSPFLPIQIPAGTRISARIQNGTGSGNYAITLYGVY